MKLSYDTCRCRGYGCTLKEKCLRYTDINSPEDVHERQIDFVHSLQHDGLHCNYFIGEEDNACKDS